MRKALNIEHILCDMSDLLHAVASGTHKIVSNRFDSDDDLIVVTRGSDGELYDWEIGFDSDEEQPEDFVPPSETDSDGAPFIMDDVPNAELRITEIQALLENDFDMSRREERELVEERDDLVAKVNRVKTEHLLPEALASLGFLLSPEDENDGYYYVDLYAQYDDEFSDRQIAAMIDSGDPVRAFVEAMDEGWGTERLRGRDEIIDKVLGFLVCSGIDDEYLNDEGVEQVRDYVMDHVDIRYPEDHYLDQEVAVTLIIDSGDGNYDYTLNAQYPSLAYNAVRPAQAGEEGYVPYDMDTFISEKAGIAWLASTQGYTRGDLHRALLNDDIIPTTDLEKLASYIVKDPKLSFLQSMYYELANCSSSTPCVAFMVRMTLRQLLILNQLINEQDRDGHHYDATENPDCGTIKLRKDTWTILFDFISGAGSLFANIQMEKDVDVPIRFIRSATPNINGCQGVSYSVANVYGCSEEWSDTVLEIAAPKELTDKIALFDGKIRIY